MSSIVLTGQIHTIFPAEIVSNSFEKRIMWLTETSGNYPNTWSIEFQQGDCNLLDSYRVGQMVICKIDLRGRHWSKNGREGVMNTLKCWNIASAEGAPKPAPAHPTPGQNQPPAYRPPASAPSNSDVIDDAPF